MTTDLAIGERTHHSVEADLKQLILAAISQPYTSLSSMNEVQTGNHYQSLDLRGERTSGHRSDRREFIDLIDFSGKRVLDLGSNLGELSRVARARGAALVDGFEYDSFFVETANAITAYNGVTRVSFFERDLTDPSVYREHYDIVLAFAVFNYIEKLLAEVASITDELLVVETHKLEENRLEQKYIGPLSEHFPCHRVLGYSDWLQHSEAPGKRAVVVFARDPDLLSRLVGEPPVVVQARPAVPRAAAVDIRRTQRCRFFDVFAFDTPDERLAAVADKKIQLDSFMHEPDLAKPYVGWAYWLLFVKGYLQYRQRGVIGAGNVYFDYLMRRAPEPEDDSTLSSDEIRELVTERVARRFADLEFFERRARKQPVSRAAPAPVHVIVSDPAPPRARRVYEPGVRAPLRGRWLDGYHRLFGARLFGLRRLPMTISAEWAQPGPLLAEIDRFSFDGSRLAISGWCAHPEQSIEVVEIRIGPATIAHEVVHRWREPRTRAGEPAACFSIETRCELPADRPTTFDVVGLSSWLPVGKISVPYVPGVFAPRDWPPRPLGVRLLGRVEPESLGFRSVKAAAELLSPLKPMLELGSVSSVLSLGASCVTLLALPRFLPSARITASALDEAAVEWCRRAGVDYVDVLRPNPPTKLADGAFELVLLHSLLPWVAHAEAWLAEARRLVKPGGYVVATVAGEFAAAFLPRDARDALAASGRLRATAPDELHKIAYQTKAFTKETCSRWFDVVEYVEGAVDAEDLVIMRPRPTP
jgi:SAM-dependent methyltransferase